MTFSADKLIAIFSEQIRRQGISWALLLFAAWFFHTQAMNANADLKKCNEDLVMILTELVENNTTALEELQESLVQNQIIETEQWERKKPQRRSN